MSFPVFHPHGLMFHLDFLAVPLKGLKVSLKQQWTDFSLNRIQSIGKRARNRLLLFLLFSKLYKVGIQSCDI